MRTPISIDAMVDAGVRRTAAGTTDQTMADLTRLKEMLSGLSPNAHGGKFEMLEVGFKTVEDALMARLFAAYILEALALIAQGNYDEAIYVRNSAEQLAHIAMETADHAAFNTLFTDEVVGDCLGFVDSRLRGI